MDFAVTSGIRHEAMAQSINNASSAVTTYEDRKRNHLDTARQCWEQGVTFAPMVVEAVGGTWGPTAKKVFAELAQTKSLLTGEPKEKTLFQLHQSLDVVLHRENARSVLKRMRCFSHNVSDILDASATLNAAAAEAAISTPR